MTEALSQVDIAPSERRSCEKCGNIPKYLFDGLCYRCAPDREIDARDLVVDVLRKVVTRRSA